MDNRTKKPLRFRRVTSMMIAAVMAATCFTAVPAAYAEDVCEVQDIEVGATSAEWDGSIASNFAGGKGTEAEPFLVANGSQLALIANEVNNSTDFEGVYFKLTQDILLNDDISTNANIWTPIGNISRNFNGTFDGDGHKVIGMVCTSSSSFSGLFGCIGSEGTVKNVSTTGSSNIMGNASGNICGRNYGTISCCTNSNSVTVLGCNVGGICGYNNGTINNCKNTGVVSHTDNYYVYYIGGISGSVDGGAIIECINTGKVSTTNKTSYKFGGICGQCESSGIEKCVNTGNVSGLDEYFGGICGRAYKSGAFECSNTATVSAEKYVGGAFGSLDSSGISECFNKGSVTGTSSQVGGICGYEYKSSVITCYNTGKITGDSDQVGGITGLLQYGSVEKSYNIGAIIGKGSKIGGIVGQNSTSNIIQSYNSGTVSASADYAAGIAGYVDGTSELDACYNTGDISGASHVGGVWAESSSSNSTLTECYNTGEVSGTGSTFYPVGETVGVIENVYYNSDLCTASHYTNAAFAKSTTELTAATAIADLGFSEDIWGKKANTAYYLYYPDLVAFDDDNPLFVKAVPTPQNLKATAGDGKVTLSWTAVEGAAKYALYYYYNNEFVLVNSNITSPQYTVTGLTNGEKYGFKVHAYANKKWSASSTVVYATPAKSNPVPQNLKATAGDGKVVLTWDAVPGATAYTVKGGTDATVYANSIKTNTATVTGLKNGTTYTFRVFAYVDGKWSAAAAVKATPVTTIPQNLKATAGDGKVVLTWDAVPGATAYTVKGGTDATVYARSIKTNTATVTGLTNGKEYIFRVFAYVNGKWSGASVVRATPVTTTPQNVKATAGDGKVTLKWDAVDGATAYTVKGGSDSTIYARSIKNNTATVTGLKNGTSYIFRVFAYVNGKWSGAAVVRATPVTTTPQNVKATVGDGKVTLTWDEVPGATAYTVKGGSDSTIYAKSIKTNTTTVTGLKNGTTYTFRVFAYVNGKWSAAAVVRATPNA